jgi:CheY-like chemotaxis protein/two-component sensor histidine kinase
LVIINDILDLSKIHAGELVLEEKPVNIRTIVDAIVFSCSPKIGNKPIEIVNEIDEKIPTTFMSDPVRLKQILLNLFTNAIKFTFQGRITIGADLVETKDDEMLIRFFVKDTGIGIDKSKHEMIFSTFTQASSDTTRKFGGTGLGLSICKELVEMQGGTISVESHPGLGSIFEFIIRFKQNPYPEIEEETATNENYELLNNLKNSNIKKVLLAEDNEINQMLVVDILEGWDFKIDVANNGQEALEMLELNNYSLILMDVHMPKMDGYDTTKAIRNDFSGAKGNIPIIAMTAAALKGEVERCLSVGMNDYISKPFEKHELYEKIIKHIKD